MSNYDNWDSPWNSSQNEEEEALREAFEASHMLPPDKKSTSYDEDLDLDDDEYDLDDSDEGYGAYDDEPGDPDEVRMSSLYPPTGTGKSYSLPSGPAPGQLPPGTDSGTTWWK